MPIPDVVQPDILPVEENIRLRKFDDQYDFAFRWYQDTELVWLVDGVRIPYTEEKLGRMYHYLDCHGELYFIEVLENQRWKPVGDVCFWHEDLPIVIGDAAYRGKGIGKRVIAALINRARELKWDKLSVSEIYEYNAASRKCFESSGFHVCGKTEDGNSLALEL